MLQQHVTIFKLENSNLQEKTRKDRQNLKKCWEKNEQYGRRFCLRTKNTKKNKNESPDKFVEAVKCLFSEASIIIPDASNDRAHRVSRTDDTVIVHFTAFRHALWKGRNWKME